MKVFITGVTGFVGQHLAQACLARGWSVIGVSRSGKGVLRHENFTHVQKDVSSLTAKDLAGVRCVFHLAATTNLSYSISHPIESTEENIGKTIHLLDLCVILGVERFVFASTATVYGSNPIPWREDMPPSLLEPYSWQKLSCEHALEMWRVCYGLNTVSLRLFQIFGENYRDDSVFKVFADAKKEGKPIPVTALEKDGAIVPSERDFVFVGDVAEAFMCTAESRKVGEGEVINIGSGRATSLLDVAKKVGGDVEFIPLREFEVLRHEADIAKARELLGWHPTINVSDWLEANSFRIFG